MPRFCPTCGKQLQFENAEICPNCGVRIQPPQKPTDVRNPWIAVLLSFLFLGWGQWYNGRTWDGLKFFGAFWGSYFLMIIFSIMVLSQPLAGIFVLILIIALIGIWVYGMYDAYSIAEKINRGEQEFSGKSGWFWLPLVLLALAVLVIIAAVIAAFTFGMAGNIQKTSDVAVPTNVVAVPTIINSNIISGWVRYTNYDDHFTIYKPSDWTVVELSKSQVSQYSKMDATMIMDKFVYIYTPNLKGFIMIYGADLSGTLASIFNDPGKTQISDDFYNEFVNGIKEGETDQIKIISMEKDGNYYLINGNPARRVTVYSQMNGENLHGDAYVIAKDNRYYIEIYFAMAGSTGSDASTATTIMRSLTTTA